MKKKITGIHHITSIVGNVQENVNFYGEILGLRLVKKTVNFDDPQTYHLYFGDEDASPGTIITFFPHENARKGIVGDGQVGVTSYVIPLGSMEFWEKRLDKFNIKYGKENRFNEEFIAFEDPHGLKIELVEREEGKVNTWTIDDIDSNVAIKGFGGAVFYSLVPHKTADTLENVLGLEKIGEEEEFIRFKSSAEIGNTIDIRTTTSGRGINSVGTVHHIAWRADDSLDQLEWQSLVRQNGFTVTDVRDRNYFEAIYFREKGGILFEIATDGPGFAIDEDKDSLGENLMLPEQYEKHRGELEKILTPINLKGKK